MATKFQVLLQDPTINIIKEHNNCRCVNFQIQTRNNDVSQFQANSIDDIKALYGLLGYALGLEK